MVLFILIALTLLVAFFNLILQKYENLNLKFFSNNFALYSSYFILILVLFKPLYLDSFSEWEMIGTFLYIIGLIFIITYVLNVLLSKFDFSLKNKTFKPTLFFANLLMGISYGLFYMYIGAYQIKF